MDCLFCKIIRKEIPSDVIFENDFAIGVLDVNPVAPGHSMVIPRSHSETIVDLPENLIEGVFGAVREVLKKLKEKINPDAFTIGINHGRAAGQAIDHLHVHVVPRWKNDGGASIHGVVKNQPDKKEFEEIKKKFRTNN